MQRSAGVTVVAVLQFLGSLMTLGMAGLMFSVLLFAPKQEIPSAPGAAPAGLLLGFAVAVYLCPAIWGFATSIGVWRLKNWARISTIVFSVLLCLFGVFGVLAAIAMPMLMSAMPTQAPNAPEIKTIAMVFMLVFSLGELTVGIWWAIYFTRKSVVAQFVPPPTGYILPSPYIPTEATPVAPALSQERPISITIIAWFVLLGAAFYPFALFMRTPLVVFGELLTGAGALIGMTLYLFVHVYIGVGLLKLWSSARVAGIVYYVFGFLNAAVTWLRPGASELFHKIVAAQPKMFGPTPAIEFPDAFFKLITIGTAVVMAVPIYFLVTRKAAFERKDGFSGSA